MKKKIWISIIAAAAILALSGCSSNQETEKEAKQIAGEDVRTGAGNETETTVSVNAAEETTLEAYIEGIDGKILLLADELGGLYQLDVEGLKLWDESGKELAADDLAVGMAVDLVFDGITMRNLPATIPGGKSLTVVSGRTDPYAFYLGLLNAVWEDSPELNQGVELVALDLSETKNLKLNQRYVIQYLMSRISLTEVRLATEDELENTGVINEREDRFADGNGMLITIEDDRMKNDEIEFEVEKWVSDTQSVKYDDGLAAFRDGAWKINLGKKER